MSANNEFNREYAAGSGPIPLPSRRSAPEIARCCLSNWAQEEHVSRWRATACLVAIVRSRTGSPSKKRSIRRRVSQHAKSFFSNFNLLLTRCRSPLPLQRNTVGSGMLPATHRVSLNERKAGEFNGRSHLIHGNDAGEANRVSV